MNLNVTERSLRKIERIESNDPAVRLLAIGLEGSAPAMFKKVG